MSKEFSANIHDPNHTADDYDLYFNGEQIESGSGGLKLLYRNEEFVKVVNGNRITPDGRNLIIDFGIPMEIPDYVYMGSSPTYAGSYFFIMSSRAGNHVIKGMTISGTSQSPISGTVSITKENDTTLKFSSSEATEFQERFWLIALYKEN